MRIGINGLLLSNEAGYRQSGIDRYVRGLLSALPAAMPNDELVVFANPTAIDAQSQFTIHATPAFTGNKALRVGWEQIGLPRAIRAEKVDLFHGTAFALPARLPVPGIVTIHDLAFLRWPEQVPKGRALHLTRAVRSATGNGTRVIAVSEATKQDVIELLNVDADRIDVTPLGVDARFRRSSAEAIADFRKANELTRPFVLAVGNREPRKNLAALVRAFAKIKDSVPHELIHAGGAGWKPDELDRAVAESRLGDRLRFVDFVPHSELPAWYSAADCFVMPSHYEGFGLPLLEALACGAPSIASNRSSLPEVAGDAAYLCNPDADSIAAALAVVLHDGELRQRLHESGPVRAAEFTWNRTAALTAASYRKAVEDA
ncbi:MAG: glycosyltransferase family 4 protein [Thermomicrobiales bacterium]|nr:glycosyltransferase family 4 protein [Thermomicrobiales bacterium]